MTMLETKQNLEMGEFTCLLNGADEEEIVCLCVHVSAPSGVLGTLAPNNSPFQHYTDCVYVWVLHI